MYILTNKKHLIKLLFLCSIFLFISIIINSRISHQDSWILDGIFVPIILYTVIFVYYFENETDLSKITLFSSIFIVSLSFVPGLKYELFYGNAVDQAFHYRFVQDILAQNMIPLNRLYSEIPLMHLFLACLAIITGSDSLFVMKYGLPLCFGTLPFIFCTLARNIYNNYYYTKYTVLASTMPLTIYYYTIGGTSFAILIVLFFLLIFPKTFTSGKNRVQYSLLSFILILSLLLAHSVTPLVLSISLIIVGLFFYLLNLRFNNMNFKFIQKKAMKSSFILIISMLSYWMYKSHFFFNTLVSRLYTYTFSIKEPRPPIPSRFFEISMLAKCQVLFVYHISDFILFLLVIIGISIFHLNLKRKNEFNKDIFLFFVFYFISILLVLLSIFITKMGDMEYIRIVTYGLIISPIFVGITFLLFRRFIPRRSFFLAVITLIFVLSFFQYYPCQPLIPRISTDGSNEDYLVPVNMVNSIYQTKEIDFIRTKTPDGSIIGGDKVTLNQMNGFMNYTYVKNHVLWYSPLVENLDRDKNKDKYDFYVTHKPGKAGILLEQYEFRNEKFILNIVNRTDLIYNNGESFVLNGMIE